MRILTIVSTRPASGVLVNGAPAPALPLMQSIPLDRLAGVALNVQFDPPQQTGQPAVVSAQVVLAQMDNGASVAVARNLSPADTAKQAQIQGIRDGLVAKLKDDTIAEVLITYAEIA